MLEFYNRDVTLRHTEAGWREVKLGRGVGRFLRSRRGVMGQGERVGRGEGGGGEGEWSGDGTGGEEGEWKEGRGTWGSGGGGGREMR